jgi:phosphoribosylformylglycinamidine synthase I
LKFGVIVFPGTWSDVDSRYALDKIIAQPVSYVWHQQTSLAGYDCVILPDGYSRGDYLRAGAHARLAPIVSEVERFARRGGLVLGICRGFQMLCDAGLLPGRLLANKSHESPPQPVHLRVETTSTPFTCQCQKGQVLQIPISHHDSNFYADEPTLEQLEGNGQIAFRYCSPKGEITQEANPDGSPHNIAGITNKKGNVLGMMPDPERACDEVPGSVDGAMLFESVVANWQKRIKA